MNRSSIFSLLLTVIVVVAVAEVLANDYGTAPSGQDIQAEVLDGTLDGIEVLDEAEPGEGEEDLALEGVEQDESEEEEDSSPTKDADEVESAILAAESAEVPEAKISFGVVQLAGFEGVTLQRLPFNGILFERLDLRDFKSVPVLRQKLLLDNRRQIGEFYELHADSSLLAGEIYLFLQEKSQGIMGGAIHETNEYGDSSFFINYADRGGSAFLVVKLGGSVYALTYEKDLHPFITRLILLLQG